MNSPAIVICAYNRPASLSRLLSSIGNAHYESKNIELIISIDFSGNESVRQLAEAFSWDYGTKRIIKHSTHLGLKQHILLCADLTEEYGSVILLEDDLVVSPYFYSYAAKAYDFYREEKKIAGISLYNYQVAENCFYPFKATDDGSDVYFMQVASSLGQLWTKEQWQAFRSWLTDNPELPDDPSVPKHLHQWGEHSWKKHFNHYLISSDTYFVFPRLSLTTCFEDKGTNSISKNIFHAPLQVSNKDYDFQNYEASSAIYDAWFEIKPAALNKLTDQFKSYNYEVDLYGTKEPNTENDYILTSNWGHEQLYGFSADMFPLECNIILNVKGNALGFYKKSGNTFKHQKIHLQNYLDAVHREKEISIVLPILNYDRKQLQNTLNSLINQNYPYYELILVVNSQSIGEIEEMLSGYRFRLFIIPFSDTKHFDHTIANSLKQCSGELITVLNQGSVLMGNAMHDVNLIFNAYSNINWIKGVNELYDHPKQYESLNVFDYRLTPFNIYSKSRSGTSDFCLEGHFFKRNCITSMDDKSFLLNYGILSFIEKFQLHIVVKCFISKSPYEFPALKKTPPALENGVKPEYEIKDRFMTFLFGGILSKKNSTNWLYTAYYNFPDVLRYDLTYQTFYFNKN